MALDWGEVAWMWFRLFLAPNISTWLVSVARWQIWKLLCNSEKYVLFCEMFLVELIWSIFISLVSNLDPDIQTMDEAYWSEATEWSQSLSLSDPLLMLGFKDFQFNKHWMQQSSSLKESFINFSESKQSSLKMLKTQEIINSCWVTGVLWVQ